MANVARNIRDDVAFHRRHHATANEEFRTNATASRRGRAAALVDGARRAADSAPHATLNAPPALPLPPNALPLSAHFPLRSSLPPCDDVAFTPEKEIRYGTKTDGGGRNRGDALSAGLAFLKEQTRVAAALAAADLDHGLYESDRRRTRFGRLDVLQADLDRMEQSYGAHAGVRGGPGDDGRVCTRPPSVMGLARAPSSSVATLPSSSVLVPAPASPANALGSAGVDDTPPPHGWVHVASRSRPDAFCLENLETGERVGAMPLAAPKEKIKLTIPVTGAGGKPVATSQGGQLRTQSPAPLANIAEEQTALSDRAPFLVDKHGEAPLRPQQQSRVQRRRSFVTMESDPAMPGSAAARKAAHKARIAARKVTEVQRQRGCGAGEEGDKEIDDIKELKRDSVHDIWASSAVASKTKAPVAATKTKAKSPALHLGAPSPRHGMAGDVESLQVARAGPARSSNHLVHHLLPGDDGPLMPPHLPPPPLSPLPLPPPVSVSQQYA